MKAAYRLMMAFLICAVPAGFGSSSVYDGYFSIFGGWSMTAGDSLDGYAQEVDFPLAGPINAFSNPYGRSDAVTGGLRVGVWGREGILSNLGLATDISYYRIDSSHADTTIGVLPFTLMGMYRVPLMVTDEFPQGRVQPYLGLGMALVLAESKTRVEIDGTPRKVSAPLAGVGIDVRAGYSFGLTETISCFVEYRYLYADVDGNSNDDNPYDFTADYYAEMETEISTHQLLTGFSFIFW